MTVNSTVNKKRFIFDGYQPSGSDNNLSCHPKTQTEDEGDDRLVTAPVCKIDFRVRGQFLYCMKSPEGQEGWNGGEYHEIVPYEKIVYSLYFADSKGNKIDPAEYGSEHVAIEDARDVVIFEDFGNGQTELTMIGNEPTEDAKNSGQLEGWNETFEKVAAVIDSSRRSRLQ